MNMDLAGLDTGRLAGAWSWLASFPRRFRRETSDGAYRPEIDGLRFFAIAFVIFGHSIERADRFFASYQNSAAAGELDRYLQLAPFGVHLFFAISGFILATQAIKSNRNPLGAPFLKAYFGRRILRIEPPYFLLLIATWALISVTGYVPEGTHRFDVEPHSLNVSLIGSLFYIHDLVWGTFPRLFPPGWSLEVEVQFYLLAPLLFWLWSRLPQSPARVAMAGGLLAVGAFFSILDLQTIGPLHVEFSLLHMFDFFWLGIILAYGKEGIGARLSALAPTFVTALGWSGLALCVLLPNPSPAHPALIPEVLRLPSVYLGVAAMFASALDARSGFRRFCARPWISLIGGACYSIYLVHLQVIQVLSALVFKLAPHLPLIGVAAALSVAAMATVAVGLTYYVQIERRFMARDWPARALAAAKRALRWGAAAGRTEFEAAPLSAEAPRPERRRDPTRSKAA
jgi:peptidoglycan/LPS O-acetylase OafA/YrhL